MEPHARLARHRAMRMPVRPTATALLVLIAALVLAACGGPGPTPTPATIDSPEAAVAVVQARTPFFDDFGPLRQDAIGQDHWWEAKPLDGTTPPKGWTVSFTAGWGDCQAGCIDRHSWTWNVTPDGAITFVAEDGSPLTEEILAGLNRNAKGPGVGGRVTSGPTCPVEIPNDPTCAPRPVAGAVLVFRNGTGAEVARLTTDGSGLFRSALEPGQYTLEPQSVEGLMGTAAPVAFEVAGGGLTLLEIGYDSGIR